MSNSWKVHKIYLNYILSSWVFHQNTKNSIIIARAIDIALTNNSDTTVRHCVRQPQAVIILVMVLCYDKTRQAVACQTDNVVVTIGYVSIIDNSPNTKKRGITVGKRLEPHSTTNVSPMQSYRGGNNKIILYSSTTEPCLSVLSTNVLPQWQHKYILLNMGFPKSLSAISQKWLMTHNVLENLVDYVNPHTGLYDDHLKRKPDRTRHVCCRCPNRHLPLPEA
jgi:hypothetical protein